MHGFQLPTNISAVIQDRNTNTPSTPSVAIVIWCSCTREASKTVLLVSAVKD